MKKNFTHSRYNLLLAAGIMLFVSACNKGDNDNDDPELKIKYNELKKIYETTKKEKENLGKEVEDLNAKLNGQTIEKGMKDAKAYTSLTSVQQLQAKIKKVKEENASTVTLYQDIANVLKEINTLENNAKYTAFLGLQEELGDEKIFPKLGAGKAGFRKDSAQINGGNPFFGTEDHVLVANLEHNTFADCLGLYLLLPDAGYKVEDTLDLEIFAPYESRDIDWLKGMLSALEKVKDDADFVKRVNEINFTGQILLSKDSDGNNLFINGHDSNFTIGNDDVTRELIGMLEPAAVFNHIFSSFYDEIYFTDDIEFDNLNTLEVRFLGVDVTGVDLRGKEKLFAFIFGKAKSFSIFEQKLGFNSCKNNVFCEIIKITYPRERDIIYADTTIDKIDKFLDLVGRSDDFCPEIIHTITMFLHIGDVFESISFNHLKNKNIKFITNLLNSKLTEMVLTIRPLYFGLKKITYHTDNSDSFTEKDISFNSYPMGSWKNNLNKENNADACLNFFRAFAKLNKLQYVNSSNNLTSIREVLAFTDDTFHYMKCKDNHGNEISIPLY